MIPVKRAAAGLGLIIMLAVSAAFAGRMWTWVLEFDPGFVFDRASSPTGPPLTPRVTLVLLDGLRLDASRRMPALNALRARGADMVGEVFPPSFSRPGRASVAVGAPPAIHGVTTNRQKRAIPLDNLIRRVAAAGGTCRVAGSKIWASLFNADISRCGSFKLGETKEGPGAFVRQVPDVRASQDESAAFVLAERVTLRIVDFMSTDFAAHEYGGASAQYADEVVRADAWLAALVGRLDLSKEAIVVTTDHGHIDAGGHGGGEREVLTIPIVMAGKGVKPAGAGVVIEVKQTDIAPTVAALLGADLPAASSGTVIESALDADPGKLLAVRTAGASQSLAWNRAVTGRLGVLTSPGAGSTAHDSFRAWAASRFSARLPVAVVITVVLLGGAIVAIRGSRITPAGLIAGLTVFAALVAGPIRMGGPRLSFSTINYDEMLIPFFMRIIVLACAASALSWVGALLVERRSTSSPGLSGSKMAAVSLAICVLLAIAIIVLWLHHGLLSPLTIPRPDLLVEAYALTLSIAGISASALIVVALRLLGQVGVAGS